MSGDVYVVKLGDRYDTGHYGCEPADEQGEAFRFVDGLLFRTAKEWAESRAAFLGRAWRVVRLVRKAT